MAEINDKESNLVDITIGDKKYKVEIADTPEKQEKGLMGRESLPKDQGMLFIYDEPKILLDEEYSHFIRYNFYR